jgi:hypothetical protein
LQQNETSNLPTSRKIGPPWAFVLGLAIYVLDGLIFLVFQLWFPLAFHVFVVYSVYRGFAANRKLKLLEAEIAEATSGLTR